MRTPTWIPAFAGMTKHGKEKQAAFNQQPAVLYVVLLYVNYLSSTIFLEEVKLPEWIL
jgi:hypothetical protein